MKKINLYIGYFGETGFPEERVWNVPDSTRISFCNFLEKFKSKLKYKLMRPPYLSKDHLLQLGTYVKKMVISDKKGNQYELHIMLQTCHGFFIRADSIRRKPEIEFFKMLRQKYFKFSVEDLKSVTKRIDIPGADISLYAV